MAMAYLGSVLSGLPRLLSRVDHAIQLFFQRGCSFAVVRAGDDENGVRDSGGADAVRNGHHANLPSSSKASEWTPPYVLGGLAMTGLFIYAFKFGMDTAIAGMINGLIGVLVGMAIKSNRNGNGNGR